MSDRSKAIEQAILQIEKQFGRGAIMKMGETAHAPVEVIPTGAIALDLALGVGGIPRGRVVEIFGSEGSGKTTLALHTIASAQRAGGTAAFIDAEHALDATWARTCGVNTDDLLISQPDTGEQALEIAETLVRSGAVDIIVIDSVAALVPRAEIEGEMGDAHVGLQARLMSQALRKLTGAISKTKTSVVFINQIRERIGVMFGCFSYTTRVTLADGSQEKIGKLVTQRRAIDVLSVDLESGKVVSRPITNWFNNGPTDGFLVVAAHKPSGNGRAQFSATPEHEVLTPEGFARIKHLRPGDQVMNAQRFLLSDFQLEVVRGSLLGDGNLARPKKETSRGVKFRLGHGPKQREYLKWKASLFRNIPGTYWERSDGKSFWDSTPLPELFELREDVYQIDRKRFDRNYLASLTPFSLAIWYMDDGGFTLRGKAQDRGRVAICVEGITLDSQDRLIELLRESYGVQAKLHEIAGKAILRMEQPATDRFHALIAPYVHTSMEYKLLPRYRGRFAVEPQFKEPELKVVPAIIRDIHAKPPPNPHRKRYRYDIEVEGTHNYLVDGVVVHNSPETQPGGRALKFYASVRLDIRRIEPIKNGQDVIGNRVRVKVVKNKVAPPFKAVEIEILGSEGISREGGLLDMGVATGVVGKSGAWFTYGKERVGQGRENSKQFLRENRDLAAKIEAEIRERAGQVAVGVGADEA